MTAGGRNGQHGVFDVLMRWILASMSAHMLFFTLITAVPSAIWLRAELRAVDALTPLTALMMVGLSVAGGLAAAYGLWLFHFKSRRLP
jgi:hypothetical protein